MAHIYALQDTNGKYYAVTKLRKDIITVQRELREDGIPTSIVKLETMTRKEYAYGLKKGFNQQLEFNL